jgi:hypothetical protein
VIRVRSFVGLLVVALPTAIAPEARALPLYASREGATCVTCHYDPNGGGMRNEYGFQYAKNRHMMEEEERWAKFTVDPKLTPWLQIGFDTRILYVASHVSDQSGLSASTFFPMQGQLNFAVTPIDELTLVASRGIVVDEPGFPSPYVARQLYALFRGMPADLFIKVGRFRLPFGLRQADHTSFVRSPAFLPYDSQQEDAGIEVGSVGRNWFGAVSFTDGSVPFAERAQTFSAKVGRASEAFQAGVSGYHRFAEATATTADRWAAYASATRGKVTLLGEYAGGTTEGGGLPTVNSLAAFAEVDYRASRGVDFLAKFDYFEQTGGLESSDRRYTLECDLNPMPFVEFQLYYRYYNLSSSPDVDEYLAMLYIPF